MSAANAVPAELTKIIAANIFFIAQMPLLTNQLLHDALFRVVGNNVREILGLIFSTFLDTVAFLPPNGASLRERRRNRRTQKLVANHPSVVAATVATAGTIIVLFNERRDF